MRPAFAALWMVACSLLGCSDLITFGFRCPDGQRDCAKETGPDASRDGGPGEDGSAGDAAPMDSGPTDAAPSDGGGDADTGASDGATDGPVDAFTPWVRNRSFELTAGSPGNLDETADGAEIAPWQSCPELFDFLAGISVVESGGLLGTLSPTEGDTMAQLSFFLSPGGFPFLTQQLGNAWPAGQARALSFDLAGEGLLNDLRFTVLGATTECPEATMREVLASTPVATSGGWIRDVCIEITPDEDVEWLILHAESALPPIVDGGGVTSRVYVDNLRESATCP